MNTAKFFLTISLLVCLCLVFWYPHLMISPGKLIEGHRDLTTDCFSCHTLFRGNSSEKCISCHAVAEMVSFHQNLIEQNCIACHNDHQGTQRFSHELLLRSSECDTCHQKPKDALHQEMAENCAQCHSQTKWQPATFEHTKYFRFDSHHKSQCVTCHVNNNYRQYSCYECHEHSRSNIRGEHLEEGISDYENCTECHRSGDEDEAERLWRSKYGRYDDD